MADWVTISSLATAGGTLVLAAATFGSVKSANRAARVAEQSLMVGLRPVLIPSREDDPIEHIRFGDGQVVVVPGHGGTVDERDGVIYLAVAVRNGGNGLAVIHGWRARRRVDRAGEGGHDPVPDLDEFRRQQLDIYIPAGESGFWMGAFRDRSLPGYDEVLAALGERAPVQVDLLYGDHEGGQRAIARFVVSPWPTDEDRPAIANARRAIVTRYWTVDGHDPR